MTAPENPPAEPGTPLPWSIFLDEEGNWFRYPGIEGPDEADCKTRTVVMFGNEGDEMGLRGSIAVSRANARYIVTACNAFPDLVEALAEAETALDHELQSLLDSVCLHDCNGPVRPTAEIDALPDVERLEIALHAARAALRLARGETK